MAARWAAVNFPRVAGRPAAGPGRPRLGAGSRPPGRFDTAGDRGRMPESRKPTVSFQTSRLPGAARRGPDPDPPRWQGRAPPASLGCPPPACPSGSGRACGAPEGRRGGTEPAGPLPPCAIIPARRLAPGAWPKKRPQGTRDAAGTQVSASQRAGSDPRGARGIGRAWSPAGAVFLVAASVRRPGPAPACQAVSGEAHAPPEPAITLRGLPAVRPPRRGRIRRMRRVGPEAGRRGSISAPAGPRAARSHARHRDTPRTGHAARGDGG
ncbi:hypothetical protein JOE48_000402 [Methylobacterium sp. PvR107]|nr:hypothetical protein [Methylobacterium sp. PvR107]